MARIKTYVLDTVVSEKDIVIGSDADNLGTTKNFEVAVLRDFILSGLAPNVGGTLKVTELIDTNNNTTPQAFINSLNPSYIVFPYEVVIVTLNSSKYLLKLQDVVVGSGQTPTISSDFISLTSALSGTLNYLPKFTPNGNTIGNSSVFDNGTTVSIGTASPSASSLLQLDSTSKGLLQPRMTTVQRDAITSPAEGLTIFNTTTHKPNYYNGTSWIELKENSVSGTLNKIAKFTPDGTTVGNSAITDDGSSILISEPTFINGTSATDSPLGAELLTSSGWTSTDWSGSFSLGFTHTPGNTSVLSNTLAAVVNSYYQISYNITLKTVGSITISFGGQSLLLTSNGSSAFGPIATTTGNLTVTPSSDFDGKIVISIKQINTSSPLLSLTNSNNNGNLLQARVATGDLRSVAIGYDAGRRITTGNFNSALGYNAGANVTTGTNNTLVGYNTGNALVTGSYNTMLGAGTGQINTGGYNTLIGAYSGLSNTTGTSNTFIGYNTGSTSSGDSNTFLGSSAGSTLGSVTPGSSNTAIGEASLSNLSYGGSFNVALGKNSGRYYGLSGSTSLSESNQSLFLGASARPLGDSQTNQIVIGYSAVGLGSNSVVLGNTSTTLTSLRGQIGIGTDAPVATAKVQVDSTTQGFLPPRMTTAQRNAITSPAVGLVVFDTTLEQLCVRTSSAWTTLT